MTKHTHGVRVALKIGAGLAVLALVLASCGDDPDAGDSTTTTEPTASETPTTTTMAPGGSGIVWPADDSVAYDDPMAAVTQFATDFIGFTDPVVTNFRPGDPGMVEVRPSQDGPVTTVYLRLDGARWVVLGAATGAIAPTEPAAGAVVASPLTLRGTSTAFEGAVGVTVRDRSGGPPLAESYVTGGTMGQMGPFDETLEYSPPATSDGSVMLYATSMEDGGGVWEATVISVEFEAS